MFFFAKKRWYPPGPTVTASSPRHPTWGHAFTMTTCAMGAMAGAVMSRRRSSRVPWSNKKEDLQMRCHISIHQSYILSIFLLKIWVNQKKMTISSILGDGGCHVSRSPRGQKWPLVRRWLASTLAPRIPLWLLWRFWSLVIIWRSDHWRCWAQSREMLCSINRWCRGKMMLCNPALSWLRGWFSYRDPKRRGCTHHTQRCGVLQEWRALGGPDC